MPTKTERQRALQYVSFIDVAYECLALLKEPANAPHVRHLAESMRAACESLFPESLSGMFYDLTELADFSSDTSTLASVPRAKAALRQRLKELSDASVINPAMTTEDKDVLRKNSYPLLVRMMNDPDQSPTIFIELVAVLDRLVINQSLSYPAAAWEIFNTLDRPQIMAHPALRDALRLGKNLELPNLFRKDNPAFAWHMFIAVVPPKI